MGRRAPHREGGGSGLVTYILGFLGELGLVFLSLGVPAIIAWRGIRKEH